MTSAVTDLEGPAATPQAANSGAPGLRRPFFNGGPAGRLVPGYPVPVTFSTVVEVVRVPVADGFTQSPEPPPGPREFDTQYREPDRDDDECRAGRYDHNHTDQKHGGSNNTYDDTACCFVRQM